MNFVKITLSDGEVHVINSNHIVEIVKMGDKVELFLTEGIKILNFPPSEYNGLLLQIGAVSKPIQPLFYKKDEPVL